MRDKDEQNPYAPPSTFSDSPFRPARGGKERFANEGVNAWQDDGRAVMPRFGAELPDRCVVCNKPTSFKLKRTFQWHPQGYYLLICAGWIVYLIVMLIVRKTATLHLGLCEEHEKRRKNGLFLLWGGMGAGLVLVMIGSFNDAPALIGFAFLGMLVTIFAGAVMARVGTVWRIDEQLVYLNAGADFVRSLPDSPDGDPPPAPPRKKKKKRVKKAPAASARTSTEARDESSGAPGDTDTASDAESSDDGHTEAGSDRAANNAEASDDGAGNDTEAGSDGDKDT